MKDDLSKFRKGSFFSEFFKIGTVEFFAFVIIYSLPALYFLINSAPEVGWDYYSCVNIAQKYAEGHFKEALNAYWSPLLIWLMVPLVKLELFNHKEIIAINYFAGIVMIFIAIRICKQYALVGLKKYFLILTLIVISLSIQVLYFDFADHLSAVCLLLYLVIVSDDKFRQERHYYIYGGFTAVLCLFAKSFYMYFIFIHIATLVFYNLIISKWVFNLYIKNLFKTLLIVILALSTWASFLSWKYDRIVLNSSGKYNFTMITPKGIGEHFGTTSGLFPPPDQYSYYHWIDPTYYPIRERKIVDSSDSFSYQLSIYKYNLGIAFYTFSYFSYFKFFLLFFGVLIFLLQDRTIRDNLAMYFFSALLIMLGYTLILIEERYFSGVQILLYISIYIAVIKFIEKLNWNGNLKWLGIFILFIISISFMKIGLYGYSTWHSRNKREAFRIVEYETKISKLPFITKEKKLATAYSHNGVGDFTLFEICNAKKCQYFGSVGKYANEQEQYEQLLKYEIDYFLFYGCSKTDQFKNCINKELPFYLKDKTPLYVDSEYGVSLYAMKPYLLYK